MEIKVTSLKRCELVTLSGDLDDYTAPELERQLLGLLGDGKRNLVLNLRDVGYVSSAGLKALLSVQLAARKTTPRGQVVLSEMSAATRRTIELVGLHHLFLCYEQDAQAIGSF